MASITHDATTKCYKPVVDLINRCLEADQGNAYRAALKDAIMQQPDIYQQVDIGFRSHLGASLLGKKCRRDIWYSFRWVKEPKFEGRMVRLFNRGHMEEPRFIALLRQAGMQTWSANTDGTQFRFSNCNGHYGGSLDCVVMGVPEYEGIPMLAEFKTHSEKSFDKLESVGVQAAKWEHFIQMNQYMGHYKLKHGLYLAVNKNNDELYAEVVHFDEQIFDFDITLAQTVSHTKKPPMKINKDKNFWLCRYCDHSEICHSSADVVPSCRTCKHVDMRDGGKWVCLLQNNLELSKEKQYTGCNSRIPLVEM